MTVVGEAQADDFAGRLTSHLEASGFEEEINAFLKKHVPNLTFNDVDSEQDHESYKIFTDFLKVVGAHLEGFLQKEKLSQDTFYQQCAATLSTTKHPTFVHRLVALTDYDAFMDMAMDFCPPDDDDD